jgi:hypothetical protein
MKGTVARAKRDAALAKAHKAKDEAFETALFDLKMAEARARGRYTFKAWGTNPDVGEAITRLCDKAKSDYRAIKVAAHEKYLAAKTLAHADYLTDIAETELEWEAGL